MTIAALVPLFAVLWMLIWRGGKKLSLALFTAIAARAAGAGRRIRKRHRRHADHGWARGADHRSARRAHRPLPGASSDNSKLAGGVRFSAKVLTGFPSILAGVFAYGAIVLVTGGYSAIAGAVALSILMLPTIMLTVGRRDLAWFRPG